MKPPKKPALLSKKLEDLDPYRFCDPGCWGRCRICPADVIQEVIQKLKELGL